MALKSPIAMVNGTRNFFGEVKTELKKCTWPTKPELAQSTVVVLVSCVILAGFVAVSDLLLVQLLRVFVR